MIRGRDRVANQMTVTECIPLFVKPEMVFHESAVEQAISINLNQFKARTSHKVGEPSRFARL